MTTQEFFDKYLNQPVEAEDPTNVDQCMDLAFKYCDEMGIPRETIRHLLAYQVYTEPLDITLQYFELVPNTPNGVPQAGDMPIFGTIVGSAGHICIATGEGDVNSFKSMDQNWNGVKKCVYITHDYPAPTGTKTGILGWLRIRKTTAAPSPTITDQTRIPQINNMEVQAIRSERNDDKAKIQQLEDKEAQIKQILG